MLCKIYGEITNVVGSNGKGKAVVLYCNRKRNITRVKAAKDWEIRPRTPPEAVSTLDSKEKEREERKQKT
ncbi:hypothetical protein VNO80_03411 [Phaseolus coccineus]|uniref:Uncharacterized protein n=1 Tax=Phaseolus coccineus TaxID=3886 RepID=A0AAN9RIU0_PHACN